MAETAQNRETTQDIDPFEVMRILNHVMMQKFWAVIETESPVRFTSKQQDDLERALSEAHMMCIRTLEKEGPNKFRELMAMSTAKKPRRPVR